MECRIGERERARERGRERESERERERGGRGIAYIAAAAVHTLERFEDFAYSSSKSLTRANPVGKLRFSPSEQVKAEGFGTAFSLCLTRFCSLAPAIVAPAMQLCYLVLLYLEILTFLVYFLNFERSWKLLRSLYLILKIFRCKQE